MNQFVVLFRGINVGGKNLLPMKALVAKLNLEGYQDVSFYIQSGNIVLSSDENITTHSSTEISVHIKEIVTQHFGFSPDVFAIESPLFITMVNNNPYSHFEGKFVHCYFCQKSIDIDESKLQKYIASSETYSVIDNVFYLHAPEGIGRSKLVKNIGNCIGQTATGRNLNTVNKITAMLNKVK